MQHAFRIVVTILVVGNVAGCSYVSKAVSSTLPASMSMPGRADACIGAGGNVSQARECATNIADKYSGRSTSVVNENTTLFDLPLIGTAAAGAASIVFGGHPDLNTGLALGGATLGGLKLYANANSIADQYLWGETVSLCVARKMSWFIDNGQRKNTLWNLFSLLQASYGGLRNLVQQIETLPSQSANPATINEAHQALMTADEAMELGNKAVNAFGTIGADRAFQTMASVDLKIRKEIKSGRPQIQSIIENLNTKVDELTQKKEQQMNVQFLSIESLRRQSGISPFQARIGVTDRTVEVESKTRQLLSAAMKMSGAVTRPLTVLSEISACTAEGA